MANNRRTPRDRINPPALTEEEMRDIPVNQFGQPEEVTNDPMASGRLKDTAPVLGTVLGGGGLRSGVTAGQNFIRNRFASHAARKTQDQLRRRASTARVRARPNKRSVMGPGTDAATKGFVASEAFGGAQSFRRPVSDENRQALEEGGFLGDQPEEQGQEQQFNFPGEQRRGQSGERVFTNEDALAADGNVNVVPSEAFTGSIRNRGNQMFDSGVNFNRGGRTGPNQRTQPRQSIGSRQLDELQRRARHDFKSRLADARGIRNSVARAEAIANTFDTDFLGQRVGSTLAAQNPNATDQAGIENETQAREVSVRDRFADAANRNADANMLSARTGAFSARVEAQVKQQTADFDRFGLDGDGITQLASQAATQIEEMTPNLRNMPPEQQEQFRTRVADNFGSYLVATEEMLQDQFGIRNGDPAFQTSIGRFKDAFAVVTSLASSAGESAANAPGVIGEMFREGPGESRRNVLFENARDPRVVMSVVKQLGEALQSAPDSRAPGLLPGSGSVRTGNVIRTNANRIGAERTEIAIQIGDQEQIIDLEFMSDEQIRNIQRLYNDLQPLMEEQEPNG